MPDPEGTRKLIRYVACGAWVKSYKDGVEDDPGTWARVVVTKNLTGNQTGKKYIELVAKARDGRMFVLFEHDNTPVLALTAKQAAKAGLVIVE